MELRKSSTFYQVISDLKTYLNQRIIGQELLVNRLLIALISDGHLLVEGAPGLAKTTAIKELGKCIEGSFHRIQFTPDLLPADLTGTDVFRPQDSTFHFQQGPIFHNLVLADEINRAPAKVQSALLEAMAERQTTIGRKTYPLPDLFLVMATQNPIEQEGTYPLPEAQLDRFLMYVSIDYPNAAAEKGILQLNREVSKQGEQANENIPRLSQEIIFAVRQEVLGMFLSPALEDYMVQLVIATRQPSAYGSDLAKWLRYGASPRGTIGLDRCARSHAWLQGRDYVSPADIHAVAYDVLRHRLILSFEAEAEGITTDHVIQEILKRVAVP
ncbi:MAG: MoxR family ATPase [Gammaproteobacteria bacterium]|nr:MoxR family ATPase [Gammaproteobacteria bacterium]